MPTSWNGESDEGIVWKTPVPLPGMNSPVVWNDRVFLSGADESKTLPEVLDRQTKYPDGWDSRVITAHMADFRRRHTVGSLHFEFTVDADPALMLEYLETNWTPALAERLKIPRHALHAAAITFRHPTTREQMTINCPLAPDLQQYWDNL